MPEGVATVPENIDYPRYAEAMESHVPLPIATQIAKHDFSHRQADILMEAARSPHVSTETLETIADKTLSSGKMRGLLDIASVGKNPSIFAIWTSRHLRRLFPCCSTAAKTSP